MKFIRYALLNGLMFGALYFGLVHNVEGALNLGLFMVWGCIVLAFLAPFAIKAAIKLRKPEEGPWDIASVPGWFDGLFDLTIVAMLAWHGYAWTAALYVFQTLVSQSVRQCVQQYNRSLEGA